ncbi:protein-L-isoaspartate(D-aspartate) O-methyltransferase [Candidatus Woesearchaeota archaeon]|nr:protein-L-isoaspartate(D-aspartate) O-methyltransferase [Candidatus Woesearchaeota archaeon]
MGTKQQLLQFWESLKVEPQLLDAFNAIPREHFVPPTLRAHAYDDHPLPTSRKQSLSQPSTVMVMLKALELAPGQSVFEVGSGVGYQAALISKIIGPTGKLITVDVIPELVHASRKNLLELGLHHVTVLEADGGEGFPAQAPFDRIIITAACPTIPQPLLDQLKDGGIVLAPVGDMASQIMVKGTKVKGRLELEFLGQFVFVPLRGMFGFKEIDIP